MREWRKGAIWIGLLLTFLAAGIVRAEKRQVLNFNPEWRLGVGDFEGAELESFDDSEFEPVTLPRAWNEDDAFNLDIHNHRTGVAWYRKSFVLPQRSEEGKVYVEFEGARQLAEVWVNGQRVGAHENGVMAFGFDLTRFVRPYPETNVIAVRTDNAWDTKEFISGQGFQWSDQNFNANYGGLTKNVRLHLTGILHQTLPLYSSLGYTGVYVYPSEIDVLGGSAVVNVESEVVFEPRHSQSFEFEVEVIDRDGASVALFSGGEFLAPQRGRVIAKASSELEGLHFWSWGYGYLYDVVTRLKVDGEVVDEVRTTTGFRKLDFKDGMLILNDRPIHVKGYAQRSSNEWPALGLSVPPWLSDYSNALMVESGANMVRWMHVTPWKQDVESCDRVGLMQMLPAGDSERDAVGRKWLQRVELMRDAIVYNRNNPSVAVYEGGNNGISEEHMRELKTVRDWFDPHGGRAIGSRDMLGSKEAEYGGEMLYINKSAGIPYWQTEYSRDEGLRKYWDEFSPPYHKDGDGPLYRDHPAPTYNRNQDSHAIENIERWYDYWLERPGTGYRVNGGGLNIVFSDTNTHYRGAENYRRSGEVDAMRIPKDGFYAHQVMWNGWVDPEVPMSHILGHWNYTEGTVKDVFVVSNTDSVELQVNGKSLGMGERSSQFLFTFKDVAWERGTIVAVGRDDDGEAVCRATHETAGEPYALRLTQIGPSEDLKADGADVYLAEVEVVDKEGRRNPIAMNLVDFQLEGPAEWRGGIAQGPDNYILSQSLPVECGVNRVLVRSSTKAGTITLLAKAEGLQPAELTVDSKAVSVQDGWSGQLPDDGLDGDLVRGPTPKESTASWTRRPVRIVSASTSGSNDPYMSYDDNEATAWIGAEPVTFELEREAVLNQITLKLGGFRARSYPIRILLDGEEVFFGSTPRSLGYVTLDLKSAKGSVLVVEPLSGGEARDAFGDITELVDQGNATTGEENVNAGELSIIEIECYEDMPEHDDFDIYLLMGQSNMVGRDLTGFADQKTDLDVLAFGYDGEWSVAKDPIHKKTGRTEPGVGPGISFGRAMKEANPERVIGLVPCAVGGSQLRSWEKGGDLYEEALARSKEAMAYGRLKGVIWHQGESDSDSLEEAESYERRLRQMISGLRSDLDAPELPIVVGQLGSFLMPEKQPFAAMVNEAICNIDLTVTNVGYAPSTGLSDKGDDLHFDAESARELGRRFSEGMLELQAQVKDPEVSVRQSDASFVVKLWPEGQMPGNSASELEADLPWRGDRVQRITNTVPSLAVYLAEANGKAAPTFIVSPGGGYSYLAYNKEGVEVAAWLNSIGLNAAILKYRTPNNREGALQDVQRAIRVLRSKADDWGLDEENIGVMGFSAGGHLSARASVLYRSNTYTAIDGVDEESARPDFAILVYPAYLDDGEGRIAKDFARPLDVPPTLIVHAEDDETYVPGSILYDRELSKANVKHDFILYKTGGHGFGLRSDKEAKIWPEKARDWMVMNGIL